MQKKHKLTYAHKEAIGLLSVGTFLEYFDFMLYVHMAVVLNELFFPKSDPFTASLIAAFSFWSTFLLRPFGALIFGYIGDRIGRKTTVVMTTGLMSVSCLLMANLPTYAQIGITASWVVTICRMVQGISSMGEVIGAKLYLAELIPLPVRHIAVSVITICCIIGSSAALGVAHLVNVIGLNWRFAFGIGALIAIIGFFARTQLKETMDFVNAKKRLLNVVIDKEQVLKNDPIVNEKVKKKTSMFFFFIEAAWPVWFYVSYIYCAGILKNNFEYTSAMVIKHNFYLSLCYLTHAIIITHFVSKIHPLKILKAKIFVFLPFILLFITILGKISNPWILLAMQVGLISLAPTEFPAAAVFFHYFPIIKRFTYTSSIHAISRLVVYGISSFGVAILTNYFGHLGLLLIIVPIFIAHASGVFYFIDLEKKSGMYDVPFDHPQIGQFGFNPKNASSAQTN